jgi:hypothetical protein
MHTAKVKGGLGGVTDVAGNPLPADVTWTFTTGAPASESASIFLETDAPVVTNANDGAAIELGVRFRAATAGYITALRFYKGFQDTGTHVGNLWTNSGLLLATVTFTDETASGWQEAPLALPVPIGGNVTYVASYHSAAGYYVATLGPVHAAARPRAADRPGERH